MSPPHARLNQRHYDYSGLHIHSEIEIPEWAAFETAECVAAPDVLICLNPAASVASPADDCPPVVDAKLYRFHIPEAGRYQASYGREIVVTPAPGAGMREVRLFLLGSAWGALCYQRGLLILHASVVHVGDSCVAFCGAMGSGKSTVGGCMADRPRLSAGE